MPYDGSAAPAPAAAPSGGFLAWLNAIRASIIDVQNASLPLPSEVVANGGGITSIQVLTQAAYDALGTKDGATLYVVSG